MKGWHKVICCIYLVSLSGCGILMKDRYAKHRGIVLNEENLPPVISYTCSDASAKKLLIFFSGDGGWLEFEDELSTRFSEQGFHTIGFNSRSYFWEAKTPEQTAKDIVMLINKYAGMYKTNRIYLCGYSFGADVVPFIYNRLPAVLKNKVVALELLSPFATSDFMVHTSDLLNIAGDDRAYKVQPEIEAAKVHIFCFYGENEEPKPMAGIQKKNFFLRTVPGDHHYETSGYPSLLSAMQRLRKNQIFRQNRP
ncbi:AcvB/VirJ family lysyl-phosphatidylglycerol hydrolase [Pedobacter sp. AW31-3R]|uniref:AcvB/VirJ family lysyl-phosphatidylglycerol hydrolase n=1 Tax=Pedobacter sp. AW31-3R TaxID=3445781 RepID=UPI003F9FC8A4